MGYDHEVVEDAARLAAEICEAPSAMIAVFDGDALRTLASVGPGGPEDVTISADLVERLRRESQPVLIVPDLADAEMPGDPEAGLRFAALTMLTDHGGAGLGFILVGDRRRRGLSADRAEALGALTRLVSAHLELRTTVGRLEYAAAEQRRYERHLEEYQLRLERNLAEILERSITDSLTGLRNRRAFLDRLGDEIRHLEEGGPAVAVVLLDVDGFKPYNDSYGHPAGDRVLRRIAELFRERIRSSDILARIGGDEFAVLLPETDAEGGYVLAERLRRAVEEAPWVERPITVSAGAAAAEASPADGEALLAAADRALYEAKASGRNQVRMAG